jgi:hypothetical protein
MVARTIRVRGAITENPKVTAGRRRWWRLDPRALKFPVRRESSV